jgi:predicted nucleotidyltransferase
MVQFNRERLATLCKEHKVERLRVFGSAARGEDRADSDIDLLVDFAVPVGFFELIELEEQLAAFFGRSVDLLTERGLSPYFRDSILSRTEVLFDAAH